MFHGWMFDPDGDQAAADSTRSSTSLDTGSSVNPRTARRLVTASYTSMIAYLPPAIAMPVMKHSGTNATSLDSSSENRRQKEFDNCCAKVRRQGDRRSVEWLCRRDGRRLRACWPACDGCQGSGESGCWRAGRRGVCERTGRGGRPEPLLG